MTEAFRSTLADQAYQSIKVRLAGLDLLPGDRLSEKTLANELGISRTPVRQALQRLHHEGLLDLSARDGWAVPRLNFTRIDELYDFRVIIELHAALLCSTNDICRDRLSPLRDIWCVAPKRRLTDSTKVGELDEQFHTSLVAAGGNAEMARTHAYITDHIRIIRRLDFSKPERIAATYDEHARLLDLIFKGNDDEVQTLLKAHILGSKQQSREITLQAIYARGQVASSLA